LQVELKKVPESRKIESKNLFLGKTLSLFDLRGRFSLEKHNGAF
jgi:hypothetical protein